MNEPPTFRTPRLILRPRTLADIEACLAMDDDAEVMRFLGVRWTDAESHRIFVEARTRHSYPPGMGYWSAFLEQTFIGWILLTPLDLLGPEIEIGWRFVRRAWGRGYATEAARPILAHALQTLGLSEVVADIMPANAASVGVARKLGMRLAGPAVHAGYDVSRFIAGRFDAPAGG